MSETVIEQDEGRTTRIVDFAADADSGRARIATVKNTARDGEDLRVDVALAFDVLDEEAAAVVGRLIPNVPGLRRAGMQADNEVEGDQRGLTSGRVTAKPKRKDVRLSLRDDEGVAVGGPATIRGVKYAWDGPAGSYVATVRWQGLTGDQIGRICDALEGVLQVDFQSPQQVLQFPGREPQAEVGSIVVADGACGVVVEKREGALDLDDFGEPATVQASDVRNVLEFTGPRGGKPDGAARRYAEAAAEAGVEPSWARLVEQAGLLWGEGELTKGDDGSWPITNDLIAAAVEAG